MTRELAKKIRIPVTQPIIILNAPNTDYFEGFTKVKQIEFPTECVVLFVQNEKEMKHGVQTAIEEKWLQENGRLLIAYPKKGNKVTESFIHRDRIFPLLGVDKEGYIEKSTYKFNQMVKLDEVYTLVGIKNETRIVSKKDTQSVTDFIKYLPELEKKIRINKEAWAFYQTLTPGYKRNWARYVYSAKREATKVKRTSEVINLLLRGIKSKDKS